MRLRHTIDSWYRIDFAGYSLNMAKFACVFSQSARSTYLLDPGSSDFCLHFELFPICILLRQSRCHAARSERSPFGGIVIRKALRADPPKGHYCHSLRPRPWLRLGRGLTWGFFSRVSHKTIRRCCSPPTLSIVPTSSDVSGYQSNIHQQGL